MAENGEQNGNPQLAGIPTTPAPSRSQVSRTGRARQEWQPVPKEERISVGAAKVDVQPLPEVERGADIRPPPDTQAYGRRRGDGSARLVDPSQAGDEIDGQLRRSAWRDVGIWARVALALVCLAPGRVAQDANHPAAGRVAEVSGAFSGGAKRPESVAQLPADAERAMTTALDDLNSALEGIPGRSPEQLLREVSGRGGDCRMVWTNNLPSLVFGEKPIGPNSLASTMEGCAKAVSRLR